jgi:hypothetical protein
MCKITSLPCLMTYAYNAVMDISTLRTQHPIFTYLTAAHSYTNNQLTFTAHFRLTPDINFHPQVVISGITEEHYASLNTQDLDHYAFLLGLVEIPSYWKATCSPTIHIAFTPLKDDLQKYLYDLLINGLSEFYFINQITQFNDDGFITITSQEPASDALSFGTSVNPQAHTPHHTQHSPLSKVLLPLGGGKDSLVALKLLQNAGLGSDQLGILVLEPASPAAQVIAKQTNLPLVTAKRVIDPKLIDLNKQGYLNGHTPFSAYLSVLSSCTGYIFGYSHVALANERSANEGNITFHGLEVNHQWSKSFEYEHSFQHISTHYLPTQAPFYFSLLRPLYELQIATLFGHFYADNLEVLTTFRSCNRGQKQNIWCGECPKCLFAYLILGPFLSLEQLHLIFGQDLLAKPSMVSIAHDLLGKGSNKPLECVGMYEESLLATHLILNRHYAGIPLEQLPIVLQEVALTILPQETNLEQRATDLLKSWNEDHTVPPLLSTLIQEHLNAA